MQKNAQQNTTASMSASSAEVVACSKCHKTTDETTFSKRQMKRLKKGKPVTCTLCCSNGDKKVDSPQSVQQTSPVASSVEPATGKNNKGGASSNIVTRARCADKADTESSAALAGCEKSAMVQICNIYS